MNQEIKYQAEYCLNCPTKPCSQKGCPLNNDIPAFIKEIKNENYKKAREILEQTTVLPAICGRICPHYKQCMGSCVRGIKGEPVNIGELEAFIGDMSQKETVPLGHVPQKETVPLGHGPLRTVAIIGGGPAGLTVAAFLARKGHKVTIYEKYNYLGGLLVHGIPEFRLPRTVIQKTIDKILSLGIEVKYNQELGKNLSLSELEKQYDYIILAFGANVSLKMGIEGENLKGVYGANELLEYNNHPDYHKKTVLVNGGGNVAMDVARTIKRLGAERVIVVYRRAKEHMSAEKKEIEDAINEGVEFLFQNNIVKIIGNQNDSKSNNTEKVEKVELIKTKLIQKQGEPKPTPVNIDNSNYQIKADYVVMAIGSHPSELTNTLGIEQNKNGYIKVNENGKTSHPKIYAIGDLAGNIQTVAWAAKSGREVARHLT